MRTRVIPNSQEPIQTPMYAFVYVSSLNNFILTDVLYSPVDFDYTKARNHEYFDSHISIYRYRQSRLQWFGQLESPKDVVGTLYVGTNSTFNKTQITQISNVVRSGVYNVYSYVRYPDLDISVTGYISAENRRLKQESQIYYKQIEREYVHDASTIACRWCTPVPNHTDIKASLIDYNAHQILAGDGPYIAFYGNQVKKRVLLWVDFPNPACITRYTCMSLDLGSSYGNCIYDLQVWGVNSTGTDATLMFEYDGDKTAEKRDYSWENSNYYDSYIFRFANSSASYNDGVCICDLTFFGTEKVYVPCTYEEYQMADADKRYIQSKVCVI